MSSCEKCWGDAYMRSRSNGKSQAENYRDILKEREDNPCTFRERAGQFWDEKRGCDKRLTQPRKGRSEG